LKAKPGDLNELDIANALRAFAHFKYLDYDCMEFLVKLSIQRAPQMKMLTLAVVVNSLSELEITNPTLLNITKEVLLANVYGEHAEPLNCS
jgi:hypothetical protein